MNAKLSDFGSGAIRAVNADSLVTQGQGSCVGTPIYMAPEMYKKYLKEDDLTKIDERVDIWSLCQTFYTVAMLENPVGSQYQDAAEGKIPSFPAFPDKYSP